MKQDSRYSSGAYFFIRRALDHTIKEMNEAGKERSSQHVSGSELLEGIRDYALEQYGPMTYTLFDHWGVSKTRDFGDIVFNLVEFGVFGKTEKDDREDFDNVFNFNEAFLEPFKPVTGDKNRGMDKKSKNENSGLAN